MCFKNKEKIEVGIVKNGPKKQIILNFQLIQTIKVEVKVEVEEVKVEEVEVNKNNFYLV